MKMLDIESKLEVLVNLDNVNSIEIDEAANQLLIRSGEVNYVAEIGNKSLIKLKEVINPQILT